MFELESFIHLLKLINVDEHKHAWSQSLHSILIQQVLSQQLIYQIDEAALWWGNSKNPLQCFNIGNPILAF